MINETPKNFFCNVSYSVLNDATSVFMILSSKSINIAKYSCKLRCFIGGFYLYNLILFKCVNVFSLETKMIKLERTVEIYD